MLRTTPGRALIEAALPPDLRDPTRVWDQKGIREVFQKLAERHPEKYREVSHRLLKIGGDVAFAHGGLSFGLEHLRPANAALALRARIGRDEEAVLEDPSLDDDARDRAIAAIGEKYRDVMEQGVYDESLAERNPLALQVVSGVRGNKSNIKSLRGGDLLYSDHRGRAIPMLVTRSYSEGLSPAEYWAGAYGARKGVIDVKLGVAASGYLSKQMLHAAHRLVVTGKDHPQLPEGAEDRGLPMRADDPGNEGALLARPAGGFPRNTVMTPRVLNSLRDQGIDKILVRSPTVGGPADGGVFARDVGVRERGRMAPIGDFVGIAASNALGEKATQMTLCLSIGTPVCMGDGTTKVIEEVRIGDVVLGADRAGNTFPSVVTATFNNGYKECWAHVLGDDPSTETWMTPDHKVLAEDQSGLRVTPLKWVDWAWCTRTKAGESCNAVGESRKRPTYDIAVDNPDHLFVLATGWIVSNSSKHSGGVAGSKSPAGLKAVEKLLNPPKVYAEAATHARLDGRVDSVVEAPQGGTFVHIGGERHYVHPDHAVSVSPGDDVEAGDAISEGVPNPSEIVAHKGIGEGRRYMTSALQKLYKDSGITIHRRNAELLARGLLNHVTVDEEMPGTDAIPGDVVPYSAIEPHYEPRPGHSVVAPAAAVGKYLEAPVLHHTIGCFDDKTEALTARGWVPWPEIQIHDQLATVAADRLVFERPLSLVRSPFRGKLYAFSGRYIDYAVTPNHRFYVSRYYGPHSGFDFDLAENLHGSRFRIPQFGFPQADGAASEIRIGEHEIPYADYAELVGWWASEGYAKFSPTRGYVTIYQSQAANPVHFATIESMARRLPFPWHYFKARDARWGITFSSLPLATHLRAFGTHSHNKRLPRQLLEQSPAVLMRTFDSMMAGDGSVMLTSGEEYARYNTSSKGLADDFQELCIRAGLGSVVRQAKPRADYKQEWYCGVSQRRTVAQVDGNRLKSGFSTREYDGVVYCAEMRTGLLYVRRNGKPMLSGNSKVRPSTARELTDWGIKQVTVHPEPPPFSPTMIGAKTTLSQDPDVFSRHLGFGLRKSTLEATHRSRSSDALGTSFPAAMMDPESFGRMGATRGFDPADDEDDDDGIA